MPDKWNKPPFYYSLRVFCDVSVDQGAVKYVFYGKYVNGTCPIAV